MKTRTTGTGEPVRAEAAGKTIGAETGLVSSADACTALRRELISLLGVEAVRGILSRSGHQCGSRDGHLAPVRATWPDVSMPETEPAALELLAAMPKARARRLEVRSAGGETVIAGEWEGSEEAERHLREHGPGWQPACWTLEGYTAGFAAEAFGLAVECAETQCRARGDPECRFELRVVPEGPHQVRPIPAPLVPQTGRIEKCLRSINEMSCELEQVSFDAIITTDPCGVIASCSQGACNLLGLLPGEAYGKNVKVFLAGGEAEARRLMDRLRTEARLRNYLTEIITPAGARKPVSISSSAIRNQEGELVGTLAVAHDLTEVRRLEDELANKNRFMANILQDSADAIITVGPRDEITSWNRGAESIFGYAADEVMGRSVNIIIPPDLREVQELDRIRDKLGSHGVVKGYQTERITKDGRRIQVIFTRTAIRDDRGDVIGSSVVLKEVTTYKNLERMLAQAEHLATLGELSAGLAHEIKNPLAGIKGAIEVIRDSIPVSDMHREILGDVIHQVDRIDQIVRDLLNYAKPKPPSHADVYLPEVAQRIVTMLRKSSQRDAPAIRVRRLTEIPGFTADESQLEQVLLNLVLNAQNALPEGGNIDIRMSYDPALAVIRLEVEDDGPGIPQEIRKKLFQPFFTTRTDGIGLGLAICQKNVQYHGGAIEVQSRVGHGTTFTVILPMMSRL
ncbi:MAG: PAS domain S-box protein [Acidobacteriota bacterium]